ncbi:probable N-acetyltransferase camello isoform X1 [Xenopus laevis]|uniref:Probable N-acetyltransferase camello n=3 Tax=Xenopus laevis TaxID=8355 RepID=CMLO_XENLA|nr:probable N-acetyltransferase camello [Xenopus laevis]XP_041428570.1 probable N-acetyltransferase camello isoform X1 [Xenopus laevis]XP_041428575.1 probable N-acetyltransferase camello isoform X1 [Xenopus laevis]Q9I8W5.1 RecName: Full=Probable N-acetyltransferase camello; AltName: Full=Xcml [Xenopus laevis]AAF80482.1 putative N-acetyltransferase Camello [Xenopus laevis]AAI55931.1 Cml-A protein [Xenopus laevis]
MANVSIRKYKNSDYETVNFLFVEGTKEHLPAACWNTLKKPRFYFIIIVACASIFMCTSSYVLSLTSLVALLAVGWYGLYLEFHGYASRCQREDMLDIENSYMMSDNTCFWVAEIDRKVVGIVGAKPLKEADDELFLLHLSVARDCRQQRIGTKLCQTVIDFARQRGFKAVCLETANIQDAAIKLYEAVGFKKSLVAIPPFLLNQYTSFTVIYYRYDIKS